MDAMSITLHRDGAVAVVTIDRVAQRNAFTMAMRQDMADAFTALADDEAVHAVVLTGAGGHFCSGADTGEMGRSDTAAFLHRMRMLHRMIRAVTACPKPVIAAVAGNCVGAGWSLALACDMVIAAPDARFSQLFGRIGYAPDAGAIWHLTRLVGPMRAKEIVYSGRMIGAGEALAWGLVLDVVTDRPVLDHAKDLAGSMAQGAPLANAMTKQLFDAAAAQSLEQFLAQEQLVQPLMATTADHREGVAALRAKRPPLFTGR
jgi:2-(1,2-epoxy-1,2-dihydrophenyl)acetyl-CoA isomerase